MRSGMKKRTSKSSKRKGRWAPCNVNRYIIAVLHRCIGSCALPFTRQRLTIRGGEPVCQTNVPVEKFRCDEASRHVLHNKLLCALGCFRREPRPAAGKIR